MRVWDLYGGAGVFAAALGDAVGESGWVLTVDTSRASSRAARAALADLPQVHIVTDSVRRALEVQQSGADVAVLDPPRSGAGREVIDLLAGAGVRGWFISVVRQHLSLETSACTSVMVTPSRRSRFSTRSR